MPNSFEPPLAALNVMCPPSEPDTESPCISISLANVTFSADEIVIAVASALSSIPVEVKPVRVPTLVMLGWAAVANVPVIDVLAVSVVNDPAAAVVPPITELSITAPSRFIATDVPVELKSPSTVSRSALILVPQVSVDAPTSGFVKFKLVVNVSAINLIL